LTIFPNFVKKKLQIFDITKLGKKKKNPFEAAPILRVLQNFSLKKIHVL